MPAWEVRYPRQASRAAPSSRVSVTVLIRRILVDRSTDQPERPTATHTSRRPIAALMLVTNPPGNLGSRMQEIDEGLWHWTAPHPRIDWEVSSYYLSDERVLIDPLLPPGGLDWFEEIDSTPAHVLLSCRHHDRASWEVVEAFGAEVHCVDTGVYELEGRGPVTPFAYGDELPGGVIAQEVDSISPDETALFVPAHRTLVCADGVIRFDPDGAL